MRAVLFCNEMLGLCHLRMSLRIAGALVARDEESTALVVTGSPALGVLPIPPRVDVLKLPAAPVGPDSGWSSTDRRPAAGLAVDLHEVAALRSELSLAAVEQMRPDAVVVDYLPLGRAKDLRPTLEHLRGRGDCAVALGLWDVDDAPEPLRRRWTPELQAVVRELYDLAIVYGPAAQDDVRIEALRGAGVPVHTTGLVGEPPVPHGPPDLEPGYLVATTGGGADGFPLLDAVLGAISLRPLGIHAVLVAGPGMPEAEIARLRERAVGLDADVYDVRADMEAVIAGARAAVSMAGYSTVAELLAAGTPALLVPRAFPRAEQLNRARWLAASGRMSMLAPDDLSAEALRAALDELLAREPPPPESLTGAQEAAAILVEAAAAQASVSAGRSAEGSTRRSLAGPGGSHQL